MDFALAVAALHQPAALCSAARGTYPVRCLHLFVVETSIAGNWLFVKYGFALVLLGFPEPVSLIWRPRFRDLSYEGGWRSFLT